MTFKPRNGFMVGWTPDFEEAVSILHEKTKQGLRVSMSYFPDTRRGEGPVWMVRWPYTPRAKGTNPRAKGTNPRALDPAPDFFDEAIEIAAEVDGVSPKDWLAGVIQDALGKRLCDLELDRLNAKEAV